MKSIVLFLISLSFVFSTVAQNNATEICGYKTELERMVKRNPNYLSWQNAWYKQAMDAYQDANSAKRRIIADTLYLEIPVVFHVLYNKTAENISDIFIQSQLNELNLAFRKQNADTQRIRSIFRPIAADVRIQFVLADKDPQGNSSSGITRTFTNKTTFAINRFGTYSTDMKYSGNGGKDAWDPTSYMNIWICNMEYPSFFSITYGFATPPTGAPNWDNTGDVTKDSSHMESGVVLHYKIVGRNNPLAPGKYTEGKAAVHEVGHYLGLRHTWGDGNSTTGCSVDDGIFDTPNARAANSTCNGQNTCTDAGSDLPDQTENYMDYALDGCAAMFSGQQAHMMRYVLNTLRTGLPIRQIVYDTIADPQIWGNGISVYPNPAQINSSIKIRINGKTGQYYAVSITDASGKQVINRSLLSNTIQNVDTSGMAASVYFIVVRNADGEITGREMLLLQ